MQKTKKIRKSLFAIIGLLFIAISCMFVGIKTMPASAATYTTPTYITKGETYADGTTYMYKLDYFTVYMHSSHTDGTTEELSNGKLTAWANYVITVEAHDIRDHVSFKLLRGGYVVSEQELDGEDTLTLYSGSLSDGNYTLEYVANIGNLFSNTDYVYTYRFTVDNTSPKTTLKSGGTTIGSGSYTNQAVEYIVEDSNYNLTKYKRPTSSLYSTSYSKTYTIAANEGNNGLWTFYSTDNLGNYSDTKTVYLDTVAPVGTVTNASGATISNGGYTNSAVKYTASDTGGVMYYYVKKPNSSSFASYTAGTALSDSYGWYVFKSVDRARNSSVEYSVYYEATSPTGTVYGGTTSKSSGSYTNAEYVKYVASDSNSGVENCYVKMPNSSSYSVYASGTQLATEGTYNFYSIDKSGNQSAVLTITLDKTKPIGAIYIDEKQVVAGSIVNGANIEYKVTDNFSIDTIKVKKPGDSDYSNYTLGTKFTAEGTYYFYAVDRGGNQSEVLTASLDRTAPSGIIYADGKAVSSGQVKNTDKIVLDSSDNLLVANVYVKKPNDSEFVIYADGATLTAEGMYRFYVIDEAGNKSEEYNILVDRTTPTFSLTAGGTEISSGSYTNKQVVYSANDTNFLTLFYKMPSKSVAESTTNKSYSASLISSMNGWWEFYARDLAGNTTETVRVYIDTVKPVGKVQNEHNSTIAKNGVTGYKIKYSATDDVLLDYLQLKNPNSSSWINYTAGTLVGTETGYYTFRAIDKAGNIEEYKVLYDITAPIGKVYNEGTEVPSGSVVNGSYIKYTATDEHSSVASCYVCKPNTGTYVAYTQGTQLTDEGKYQFYSKDETGKMSALLSITLDKTAPTARVMYGSGQAFQLTASGTIAKAKMVSFDAKDNLSKTTGYVKRPGSETYELCPLSNKYEEEGTYYYYAVDEGGNQSEIVSITLDRQTIKAQLYVDGNPVANYTYTNGEYIWFDCAEKCYVQLPDTNVFVDYSSGIEFYKPGQYIFYGVGELGNSTGKYTIRIDRNPKTAYIENVVDGITDGEVRIVWEYFDSDAVAQIKTVTVNGIEYYYGDTIHTIDTGVYNVRVEDFAGNVWETTFTSINDNIPTQTLQKEYYEIYDVNGDYYSFSSYESALEFAKVREYTYVRTGEWKSNSWDAGIAMDSIDSVNAVNGTYYIYKKSGNSNEEVAFFTLERLDAVITEYAQVGIESYFYWEKEPTTVAEGENLYSYLEDRTIIANSVVLGDNIRVLLNGEEISERVIDIEGKHSLTIFDEWNNTCDYTLYVIKTAPTIEYMIDDGNKNIVTFDRVYYFKNSVTVSISDNYDEMAMFTIYGENGEVIKNLNLDETYLLTESGTYGVIAVNHAGQSQTFNIIISRNAPSISITENTDSKKLDITITHSSDKESHIQTFEIYKSVDGGETWELVEKDDYGKTVDFYTLSYSFRTSGIYKVIITDEFRTGIDAVTAQYDYIQSVPLGNLVGVENGGYTNGKVKFEWTDEAIVTLTKDGEIISYYPGQILVENGAYVLTFKNFDGYESVYSFVIDTVKPEVYVEGAENSKANNSDVKVVFEEENLTAEIYKDGDKLGEYVSGTTLTASGDYVIYVYDLAKNETEITFKIDKFVDCEININDKGLSNSVTVTANENVTVTLTKYGEIMEYRVGDTIAVPGEYNITLTDNLGNKIERSFTIVQPVVKQFTPNFDNVEGFEKVLVNGEDKRLNYGTLELFTDGVYEIGVVVDGNTYNFTIEVDSTPPTIVLTGVENGGETKGAVVLGEPSEELKIKVYRDGTEIEYTLGEELTELGQYRVVVTDSIGNESEYNFEIIYSMNGGAIALVIIGIVAVIGIVVAIILGKKAAYKQRVNKEETFDEEN